MNNSQEIEALDPELLAQQYFTTAPDGSLQIDHPSLRSFWEALSPSEATSYADFEEAVLAGLEENPAVLHARSGGWTYNLSSGMAKGVLMGAALAAVLLSRGASGISAPVIIAILPYLCDITKCRLSRKGEAVLISLVAAGATESQRSAAELYDLLPENLRNEINRLDFLDFIDEFEKTGHITQGDDGSIRVYDPDHPRQRTILL